MSNLLLNSTTTTQQQQLLLQQQQLQQQQALAGQNTTNNAGGDQGGGAPAVPEDKDPESYRQAYQTAVNEGRSPDAAAKQAYKNAAPRAEGDGGKTAGGSPTQSGPQSKMQTTGGGQADGAVTTGKPTDGPTNASTVGGAYVASSAPQDAVDTGTTRPSNYVAAPAGGNDAAANAEPRAKNSASLTQIQEITTDENTSSRQLGTSTMYNNMVNNGATPEESEVAATNTYANLAPDEHGNVDAGTVGTIALGDARSRMATPEAKALVANVTQQLVNDPQFVSKAAQATNTKEMQDILQKALTDGTLDAMSGTDESGNKKSSITGGSAGKSKASRSLNPMEMVMMAMMQAAVEGQKQAAALADEVQTNTELKRSLREQKSGYADQLRADGQSPGSASTTGSTASGSGGKTAEKKAWDNGSGGTNTSKLLQQKPKAGDNNGNQSAYQAISDALDSAGDDSSILMIKLQTASQIVTTFLQACSNVSKGVTDTTKAVIGNIGH